MAKLILNDRTEISDVIDVSVGGFSKNCTATEMAQIFDSLNDENLAKIELRDNEGVLIATYADKHASSFSYSSGVGTVSFSDIDMNAKKLAEMEVQLNDANNAIAEMSELVGALM